MRCPKCKSLLDGEYVDCPYCGMSIRRNLVGIKI